MTTAFVRSWKSLAFRGVIALAFALTALLWPRMPLTAFVLLLGIYALVDGCIAIAMGTRHIVRDFGWILGLKGLAGVGLGLAALLLSRTMIDLLALLVAFWAILIGVLELAAAVALRREIPGEVLLGVAGVASLLLGFAILVWPKAEAAALVMLLGSYALVFGAATLAQALRLRSRLQRSGSGGDSGNFCAPAPGTFPPRPEH
ncbi:MAG TPA: DUF308 domain-containing protein [Polyangiaceae bacterium]|nr:DUF308 domain-containing protein [Polyangiaceae bacterium]